MRGSCPSTVERGFVVCDMVSGLVLSLFLRSNSFPLPLEYVATGDPCGKNFDADLVCFWFWKLIFSQLKDSWSYPLSHNNLFTLHLISSPLLQKKRRR